MRVSPRTRDLAALAAICFLCFFWRLGSVGLFDINEAVYTEAAREMVLRHDYVTARFNGVLFFDKPPLALWQSAASFRLFGVSELAARLPVAVAATLLVALTYLFGARVFGRRAGLLAGAALALNPLFLGTARQNTMDLHLTLWFAVALFCFFRGFESREARGKWWYVGFWLACGLGWLAKSIPGLFPLFVASVFIAAAERLDVRRIAARVWETRPWLGIPLLAAVVLPWVMLAYRANGRVFYEQFWLLHHVKLANGTEYVHAQPFWYYLPALLAGLFPWSIFLPAAAVSAWQALRRHSDATVGRARCGAPPGSAPSADLPQSPVGPVSHAPPDDRRTAPLMLLVWSAVVLFVFSAMRSKVVSYVLPMYPAAALLVGSWLATAIGERATKRTRAALKTCGTICAVIVAAGLVAGALAAHRYMVTSGDVSARRAVPPAVILFALHSLVLTAAGLFVATVLFWTRRRAAGVWAMVATTLAFVALTDWEGVSALQSSMTGPLQSLAQVAGREAAAGVPIAVYIAGPSRPSVFFYLPDSVYLGKPLPAPNTGGVVFERGNRPAIDAFLASNRPAYVLTDSTRAADLLATDPGVSVAMQRGLWDLLRVDAAHRASGETRDAKQAKAEL